MALQEQLLLRDLPDLMRHSGLRFEAALAKGRGRYVCLLKLDQQLSGSESESLIPLYPDEFIAPDYLEMLPQLEEMLTALAAGRWDGDFDN